MPKRNWREINSEYARVYTSFRGDFSNRTIHYILNQAGLARRAGLVLDLACGAGAVLRQLAGGRRRLIGMDASMLMLRETAGLPFPTQARPPLVCAEGEHLPLANEQIDLCTIGQAIHWFDLPLLFAELRRVLHPGGWLAVLSRYPSPSGWLSALVEQVRYPFTAEGRSATPAWSLSSAPSNLLGLEQAGFTAYRRQVFRHVVTLSLEGYLSGQADRIQRLELTGEEQERFLGELRARLLPHCVDGLIREEFFDYVFMAQKSIPPAS